MRINLFIKKKKLYDIDNERKKKWIKNMLLLLLLICSTTL